MKRTILFHLIFAIFLSCSSYKDENFDQQIQLIQHFESSEQILDWFNNGMHESDIDNLSSLPGCEIMEENVILSNTDISEILSFKKDMNLFRKNPNDYLSDYGLNIAYKERKKSSNLLTKIKATNFNTLAIKRALQFFPKNTRFETKAHVYYVLTGWEWGDAYVRNVNEINGKYKIDENGTPVLIFNLSLFTKLYGETVEEQFQILTDIMSHEIFHFAFREFKKQSSFYPQIAENDYKKQLINILQNEGIAHYIHRRKDMIADFSTFIKYQKENFEELNKAFTVFHSHDVSSEEKNKVLHGAYTGRYWQKYGAISGMFMSYHIERLRGKKALTKIIENGSDSFIKTYIKLQNSYNDLPKINF